MTARTAGAAFPPSRADVRHTAVRGSLLSGACVAVALLGGCGGDDEKAAGTDTTTAPEATVPSETVPQPTPRPRPEPGVTPSAPPATGDPDSGGSPVPPAAPAPDSPRNDRPPPPGSPAERFERECEANPDACG